MRGLRNDTHITANTHKKAKKSLGNKSAGNSFDPNDLAALNRRAARFQREHELERQKGFHGQTGHAHSPYSHVFASRSGTPALDGDAPEMNSVRLRYRRSALSADCLNMCVASELGQVQDCRYLARDLQGLSPLDFSECARWGASAFTDLLAIQEPKPEQIRPYPILQETLAQLKRRWREKANYNWICSQFKSLRQDLTVSVSAL